MRTLLSDNIAIRRVGYILSLGVAFSLFAACDRYEAKKQDVEQFVLPEFVPQGPGFYLTNKGTQRRFTGSLLIWNQTAGAEQAATMLKLAGASASTQVNMLRYIHENITPFAKELDAAMAANNQAKNVVLQSTAGQSIVAADALFEDMLAKAAAARPMTDAELVRARTVFGYYCEAKLWERAVQNQLINIEYTRRPLPVAMCESVYRQLGLILESEPECAANPAGADYFGCLWKQGVLKTRLLQVVYGAQPEAIERLAAADLGLLRNRYNFGTALGATSGRAFLSLRKVTLKDENNKLAGEIQAITVRQSEDVIVGAMTPLDIMTKVESGALTFFEPPTPPPVPADPAIVQPVAVDPVADLEAQFRLRLAKFNQLAQGKWANEIYINTPFAVNFPESLPQLDSAVLQELKTLLPDVVNVEADSVARTRLEVASAHLRTKVAVGTELLTPLQPTNCAAEADKLACQRSKAKEQQLQFAKRPDVSRGLFHVDMVLPSELDRNLLRLRLRLSESDRAKAITACFDIAQQQQVSCEAGAPLVEQFTVERGSGKLSLLVRINDAQAFGLHKREQTQDPFFNIIDQDLSGKVLKIDLYPNNLGGLVDIVTGSVVIAEDLDKDGKLLNIIENGSINLADEEPPLQVLYHNVRSRIEKLSARK